MKSFRSYPRPLDVAAHRSAAHDRRFRARRMRGRALTTTTGAREHLAGIEPSLRVERNAYAPHQRQVFGSEQLAHHRLLLDADTVLSRNRAAEADAHAKNLLRHFERRALSHR